MQQITLSEEQRNKVQRYELQILRDLDEVCLNNNIKYYVGYGSTIGAVRHNGFIPWDDDIDLCMMRADFEKFKMIFKKEMPSRYFYQCNDTDPEYFHLIDKVRINGTIFKETFVSQYNIHHGVYIDVFPIDYIPENPVLRALQYYKFHFYRTGLMAKYLHLDARKGKKRTLFTILRVLYKPFSVKHLYSKATEIAKKYSGTRHKMATSFYNSYHKLDTFESEVYEDLERHKFEDIETYIPKQYDIYLRKIYGDYMRLPPEEKRITRHDLSELKL